MHSKSYSLVLLLASLLLLVRFVYSVHNGIDEPRDHQIPPPAPTSSRTPADTPFFNTLPVELVQEVQEWLPFSDAARLRQTCRAMNVIEMFHFKSVNDMLHQLTLDRVPYPVQKRIRTHLNSPPLNKLTIVQKLEFLEFMAKKKWNTEFKLLFNSFNASWIEQLSTLHAVVRFGNVELMKWLFEVKRVEPSYETISFAVLSDKMEIIRYLVDGYGLTVDDSILDYAAMCKMQRGCVR